MEITYRKGDLVALAKAGEFDVIFQGLHCFCLQNRGFAKHLDAAFMTSDGSMYSMEKPSRKGDINKLGNIEWRTHLVQFDQLTNKGKHLHVANCYMMYEYGVKQINCDYDALRMCLRKLGHIFKGKTLATNKIGTGINGGDWSIIERMITQELKDCKVEVIEHAH